MNRKLMLMLCAVSAVDLVQAAVDYKTARSLQRGMVGTVANQKIDAAWVSDGSALYYQRGGKILRIDTRDGVSTTALEPGVLKPAFHGLQPYIQRFEIEQNGDFVYLAVAKGLHHVSEADLETQPFPEAPPHGAPMKERMGHRLNTPEGKALYKQRKQTVEPVFGVVKEELGFRRFLMRGKERAEIQWGLVCLSYNLKKIFNLQRKCAQKGPIKTTKQPVPPLSACFRAYPGLLSCTLRLLLNLRGKSLSEYHQCVALTPTGC